MAKDDTDYLREARDDAKSAAQYFLDEIVEAIESDGKASDDLTNDYSDGDSYHHETHVDRSYKLIEASNLLDQLSRYEEGDPGLWQGMAPREAVSAQAAYTYGNAVYSYFRGLIEEINDKVAEENFDVGPKDWSPLKPKVSLKEFVNKVIAEF
jgi:hypothetical protein